jgi:eukaryotic-like serine/threonine-protein kinase
MTVREEELEEGAQITPTLRLTRRIGGGGMGSVWLAQHLGLDTRVVVKFIATQIAGNAIAAARFKREAAAAASVRSPHVVQMLDYGVTERGTPYIVMELLEGKDLSDYLKGRGRLPPGEVASIIKQVCKALGRAHDLGIIHRDIKPENIFLCDTDDDEPFVKLLDFGIAKDADDISVTTTGAAVGTPHYMSPEQAVGAKGLDHRTDLWSLGVLTFYLLTGRRPFQGETTGALTLAIFNGPIPRPTDVNAALPKSVDDWFLRVCSRDPDGRPPSAKILASELAAALLQDAGRKSDSDDQPAAIASLPMASPAEPTIQYGPGGARASTLERAPTTLRDEPLAIPAADSSPARTTSGLTGNISTAPGVPRSKRSPLWIGAIVAVVAVSGVAVVSLTRKPATNEPAAQPVKTIEAPTIVIEPAPTPSAAPTPAQVEPPPPAAPTITNKPVASSTKPLPPKPSAATKPSASAVKPAPTHDAPVDLK